MFWTQLKQNQKPQAMAKMAKKKESTVTTTEMQSTAESSGSLANPSSLDAWGVQEVTSRAITIPRLLIMQGMSDFVTNDKAKIGDIVESLGEKVLGGVDKGVEILPFKCTELWRLIGANGKTVHVEPYTAANSDLPDKCDYDGEPVVRYYTQRYYVLLPSELEAGGALPYVLEFKSTALSAGKKMYTQMFTVNRNIGLSPAAKTFMLSSKKLSNTKGTYAVPDVSVLRDSVDSEIAVALTWFKTLEQGAKVHEEE